MIVLRAVGGYIVSIDKLSAIAPYVGLVGIVGLISTIYMVGRKRKF